MTYLRNAVILAAVALLPFVTLSADHIQLDTGDSAQGTVLEMKDGSLSICTGGFGELSACWMSVTSLSTDGELVVTLSDGSFVTGTLQVASGVVTVTDGEGARHEVQLEDVCAVCTPAAPCDPCDPCQRTVDHVAKLLASVTDYEGNTNTEKFEFEGEWTRTVKVCGEHKSELLLKGEYEFIEDNGKTNVSKGESEFSYRRYFRSCDYWRIGQEFEHDHRRDLRLRSQSIFALGHYWIRNNCWEFYTEGGLLYAHRWFRTPAATADNPNPVKKPDSGEAELLAGFGGVWHINDSLKFTHKFEAFPQIEHFDDFLIEAESKLIYSINKHWELTGQHDWDHKSKPSSGRKRDDQTFKMKVGYKF